MRPITADDLDALFALANASTGGLTSLPQDRNLLMEKIERSLFAFSKHTFRPYGEAYLFVLEEEGEVVGCSAILAKAGGYEPIYAYQLATQARRSAFLEVNRRIRTLSLKRIHNGPSEVSSLFLLRHTRGSGVGRLLSLARFMFLAAFPTRFESTVMASLRGVIRSDGSCPFWDAICHPFFRIDFLEASRRRYSDPRFIEELVPDFPLYVDLLPREARKLIGKAHPNTEPAESMLKNEGFVYDGLIDIFDGGPFLCAPAHKLRIISNRRVGKVAIGSGSDEFLLSNTCLAFRALVGQARPDGERIWIDRATAEALCLGENDSIAYVRSHP